jgi:hypothetical protein
MGAIQMRVRPSQLEIDEIEVIRRLVRDGFLVITAGGDIPVARYDGHLAGVEAVIDKDSSASALPCGSYAPRPQAMACGLGARGLLLTARPVIGRHRLIEYPGGARRKRHCGDQHDEQQDHQQTFIAVS